jgi:DNA polymerase-1
MKVNGVEVIRDTRQALALLQHETDIAVDIETTGFSAFMGDTVAVVSMYGDDTNQLAVLHVRGKVPDGLKELLEDPSKRLTWHNGVSFDMPFMKKWGVDVMKTKVYDTLVGAGVTITSGRRDEVKTLQAEVERRLGVYIKKGADHSSWMSPELDEKQILYCAEDMLHLHALRRAQEVKAEEQGQLQALALEMAIVPAVSMMTFNGLPVHVPTLDAAKATARQYIDIAGGELASEVGEINLGSHTQVKGLLEGLGMTLPTIYDPKTRTMKSTTRADPLKAVMSRGVAGLVANGHMKVRKSWIEEVPDGPPIVHREPETDAQFLARCEKLLWVLERVVELREAEKLQDSYSDAWLIQHRDAFGRIHSKFRQSGTDTLRFASADPNIQQWPKKLRGAIGGEEGMSIVSADFSQIEVVIAAELSRDAEMLRVIDSGEDTHTMVASLCLQKNPEGVTADERRVFKAANFCLIFGGEAQTFMNYALGYGAVLTLKQSQDIIDLYFRRFRGLAKWKQKAIEAARSNSKGIMAIRLRSGGVRHLMGGSLKSTTILNTNVQGTAAAGMKFALLEARQKGLDRRLGATVHDELVGCVETRWAEEYRRELEACMLRGMGRVVDAKVRVESKVATFWS